MDVNVHLLPAEKWILSHNIFIWKKCPCSRPFAFVQLGCALGFNRIRLSNQSGYEYLAWQQFREKEREGGGEETLLETGGNQSLAIQGHRNHVSHSTSKALLSCSVYR